MKKEFCVTTEEQILNEMLLVSKEQVGLCGHYFVAANTLTTPPAGRHFACIIPLINASVLVNGAAETVNEDMVNFPNADFSLYAGMPLHGKFTQVMLSANGIAMLNCEE